MFWLICIFLIGDGVHTVLVCVCVCLNMTWLRVGCIIFNGVGGAMEFCNFCCRVSGAGGWCLLNMIIFYLIGFGVWILISNGMHGMHFFCWKFCWGL